MKKLLFILLFVFTTAGFAQTSEPVEVLAPEVYKEKVAQKQVQFIDIRTPKEYKAGHIKGARNIDFLGEDFLKEFSKLDKDQPVYIYCRSGNRSAKASEKLKAEGFEKIVDLKGGYKAWTGMQQE